MSPIYDDSEVPQPISEGVYNARIKAADENVSKPKEDGSGGGDAYFRIHLETLDSQYICSDIIMLQGRGAGMGRQKLKGFGIEVQKGDSLIADQLIGLQAQVNVGTKKYKGETYPCVDHDCDAPHCGYWPFNSVSGDMDTPF